MGQQFSDSNRVGVRYIAEASFAVQPTGPNMQELNFTSESFKSNVNTVTSDTIRSDRNVSDITQVGGGAGGDVGFELRYGDIDTLLAGALQGAWATTTVSATVASSYFSGADIHVNDALTAADNILVGQLLRVANASAIANDGDYRVTGVSAVGASTTIVTLANASSGVAAAFTSDVFAATTTLRGKNLRNGVLAQSYTIEKQFADVSATAVYTGMRATTLSLAFDSQAIMTGTIGFAGVGQTAASATIASATTAASTNLVMNASNNVARIWEGGQAITGIAFQSVSIDLNNNPRDQPVVGSANLAGIGTGRCEVTGSMTAYFENNTLINKFTAGTKSNFRFQITDASGNSYVVDIPNTTYTDMTIVAGGPNQDIVQEGSWGAAVDTTGTYAIQIDALDA